MGRLKKARKALKKHKKYLGWRGVWKCLQAQVTGRSTEILVPVEGLCSPVILRAGTSDATVFGKIFIEREYEMEVLDPDAVETVIDAGANIGLSALYFSMRYPNARIVAVEAQRGNMELLRRNTRQCPRIMTVHAALWSEEGELRLHDPGAGDWGFRVSNEQKTLELASEQVRAVTIPWLMREYRMEGVDLLKMDIEGAERDVLQSGACWMSNVGCIAAELHERIQPGCEAAFREATRHFRHNTAQGENRVAYK